MVYFLMVDVDAINFQVLQFDFVLQEYLNFVAYNVPW
jgi:hypothetical protein